MHLHILGIGGAFMGGVALLARDLGHTVTGSDAKVYPPMSTQLAAQDITLMEGYNPAHLDPVPDLVIIGNVLSRGNPLVEAVLDRDISYTSGAQWLADHVLPGRRVAAVAGTHGKSTTACMLAWILDYAGLGPGFLIGGVPENFGVSARLGDAQGCASVVRGTTAGMQDDSRDGGGTTPGMEEVESRREQRPRATSGTVAEVEQRKDAHRDVGGRVASGTKTEQLPRMPYRDVPMPRAQDAQERRPGAAGNPLFVIEADEYDTAFFDKRSKFVHYRPHIAVLNNLEYDHADIFPDLDAIKRQFHHLVRTMPASGQLVVNSRDKHLSEVLAMGCWTPVEYFGTKSGWSASAAKADGSRFQVFYKGEEQGVVEWGLIGNHNISNALAAIAAAYHAGVAAKTAIAALAEFRNIKRRLEVRGRVRNVTVYDDFAHHPTEISATLQALRTRVGDARIIAVLEPRSNSMRMGVYRDTLSASLSFADNVLLLQPAALNWNLERVTAALGGRGHIFTSVDGILGALVNELRANDHVVIMSNGDFDNIHARLLERLQE